MALTFTAGTSSVSSGSQSSTTVTLPSGLTTGDYTIIVVSLVASSGSITTPSGWSNVFASAQSTASTSHSVAVFYRKWQSGDTDPAVSHTSGRVAATPVRVQGADATTFLDTTVDSTSQASATTSIDAPSQTPVTSPPMLCMVASARCGTNGTQVT